jgi:hypothetical protein
MSSEVSAADAPWPGPYWATYVDGINVLWDKAGALSAVEKYAKAFNQDAKALALAVSQKSGIAQFEGQTECSDNRPCKSGARCSSRRGETKSYCVDTWWGICHAWAPAAILEKEPLCPVTLNGVTFEPMDLKALVTQLYDGADVGTTFTGSRCNDAKPDLESEYGGFKNPACSDIDAFFFHIAIANIQGGLRKQFVVDVTATDQVWNQPSRGYSVIKTEESTDGAYIMLLLAQNTNLMTMPLAMSMLRPSSITLLNLTKTSQN